MRLVEGGRCGPAHLPLPDILKEGKWNDSLTPDLPIEGLASGVFSD